MQVIVDQLLTTYSLVGNGKKTILFLHGWADAGKTFDLLAAELSGSYSILTLDLPGFGGSQQPETAWGLDDYSTFVSHFLKKLDINVDVIVGHSNGGSIAIYGLTHDTLSADKLVLIASAGIREKTAKKQALKLAARPAKLLLKVAPKSSQKKIKQRLYSSIGSDYLVAEHMQETFKRIVASDVQEYARKITAQTCIIYGDIDEATPVAYGERYDQLIPQSELHVIPLASHFVHQEQAPKVATIIKGFISK